MSIGSDPGACTGSGTRYNVGMSKDLYNQRIQSWSPTVQRPMTPKDIDRADRSVHHTGLPPKADVSWISEAAQALMSAEAAQTEHAGRMIGLTQSPAGNG